jgi:Rrf2 family protein
MKLSTRCRYATLALFDIAYHSRGQPTQVRQIGERQGIPVRFLEQIFQDLKRAELVDGKRGRNGGYFLRQPPEDITLGDILRATDGPIAISFAAEDASDGSIGDHAAPTAIWTEVAERIGDLLGEFTLADLCERAEREGAADGYMYFI